MDVGAFRLLVVAYGLSTWGDFIAVAALTLRVQQSTQSGWAVAGLLLASGLPVMVLHPVAGLLVDRGDTRRILMAAAGLQSLCALALAHASPLWLTYALCFGLGCGLAVEAPALFSLVPRVVGHARVVRANAWLEAARYAAVTFGLLCGGVVSEAGGGGVALTLDAGTFALAAICVGCIRDTMLVARAEDAAHPALGLDGVRFLLRHRVVRACVLVVWSVAIFTGLMNTTEVFLAKDVLDVGDSGYGLLAAATGLGMMLGALVVGRRLTEETSSTAMIVGAFVAGGALVVASVATHLLVAGGALVVVGGCQGVVNVAMRGVLQGASPQELRGRAYSAYQAALTVATLLSLASAGALIELVSVRPTIALAGVGTLVAAGCGGAMLHVGDRRRHTAASAPTPPG